MSDLQLARLSNDAFNVAIFSYIAAMVGYFAYLAYKLWGFAEIGTVTPRPQSGNEAPRLWRLRRLHLRCRRW